MRSHRGCVGLWHHAGRFRGRLWRIGHKACRESCGLALVSEDFRRICDRPRSIYLAPRRIRDDTSVCLLAVRANRWRLRRRGTAWMHHDGLILDRVAVRCGFSATVDVKDASAFTLTAASSRKGLIARPATWSTGSRVADGRQISAQIHLCCCCGIDRRGLFAR